MGRDNCTMREAWCHSCGFGVGMERGDRWSVQWKGTVMLGSVTISVEITELRGSRFRNSGFSGSGTAALLLDSDRKFNPKNGMDHNVKIGEQKCPTFRNDGGGR
jgi:hypothetical protein